MSALSSLPSVEQLLQTEDVRQLVGEHGRPLTLDAVRLTLEEIRAGLKAEPDNAAPPVQEIVRRTKSRLVGFESRTLQSVINATGVILHTNLGRAPLSQATVREMSRVSAGYSSLEFDLESGKRGTRLKHAENLLSKLLNIEAAVVVNNNAAAVLLVLSALASRKRVIIARSQLVEIGGGFRVPDVMRQSGARLFEIGTTNKVRLVDYEQAMTEADGVVMHVHRSNFKIVGFTEEPELGDIAAAAHRADRILVDDLGSGALLDTAKYGLAHEPTVQESVAAGADVICFSGDKLLGGPQAGIIIGRPDLLHKIRKHPLARAVRADKACLAGLAATILHYLREEAEREIPIWRMICMPATELQARAQAWSDELGFGSVQAGESTIGGGSLPGESMKTFLLALVLKKPDRFLGRLREQEHPIIARVADGLVVLDPRTVLPEQDAELIKGVRRAWAA